MSAESQTTSQTSSVNQLIDAVANRAKQASENTNPPTSGPGGGPSPTEETYTEGASAKENTALNREVLGKNGPEDAAGPEGGSDSMKDREPAQAANVSTAGQDPQGESRQDGPAPQAEPGTSSELSLTKKVAAWRDAVGKVAVDFVVDHKLAAESAPKFIQEKLGEAKESASGDEEEAPETDGKLAEEQTEGVDLSQLDDPYLIAAEGNEKLAAELKQSTQHQVAEWFHYGAKLAYETIALSNALQEDEAAHVQSDATKQASANAGVDRQSFLAGFQAAMSKLSMGGEVPEESAGEMAAASLDGGGDPMAAGVDAAADEGAAAEASPQELEAALQELAAANGMSIEELVSLIASAEGGDAAMGGEMGGEMGGMPPEAAKMAAEKFSAEKVNEQRKKLSESQRKLAIKQDLLNTIADVFAIGSR